MASTHRIVLLTGNERRHTYVAAELAKRLRLVGVLREGKAQLVKKPDELSAEDRAVIDQHFAERSTAEQRWLGDPQLPTGIVQREVEHGASNAEDVFEWVQGLEPEYVVLYGTSIIKPPLLTTYEGRMINIHLGLSPYYRGTGTNFWPLVERKPECVGATIHLAVLSVDAGAILAQVRPEAESTDRVHDLGTKTIMAAVAALPRVVTRYAEGAIEPRPQDLTQGKVFRRKDFNAVAVRTLWDQFASGMMDEFVADRAARYAAYPIVELP